MSKKHTPKFKGLPISPNPDRLTMKPKARTLYKPGAKWVSDYLDEIKQEIEKSDRLVVQSGTGTGKSRAHLKRKIGLAWWAKDHFDKKVVFISPTTVLTKQQFADYGIPIVTEGSASEKHVEKCKEAGIFACTAANVARLVDDPSEYVVFIDEIQDLISGVDYKPDAVRVIWSLIQGAHKVVGLSATPYPYWEQYNFRYLKIYSAPKPCQITANIYKKASEQSDHLLNYLLSLDYSQGKRILRLNSKDDAEALKSVLTNSGKLPINPKKPKTDDGEPNYLRVATLHAHNKKGADAKHIQDEGLIPDDVCLLIATSILDTGINLNNEDICEVIISDRKRDIPEPEAYLQAIARPRKVENLKITLFLKERKPGKKEISLQADFRYWFRISQSHSCTQNISQEAEPDQALRGLENLYSTEGYLLTNQNSFTGEYMPSLAPAKQAQSNLLSNLGTGDFLRLLTEALPLATLEVNRLTKPDQNEDLADLKHTRKVERIQADAALQSLIDDGQGELIKEVGYFYGPSEVKHKLPVKKGGISQEARDLYQGNHTAFFNTSWTPLDTLIRAESAEIEPNTHKSLSSALNEAWKAKEARKLAHAEKEGPSSKEAQQQKEIIAAGGDTYFDQTTKGRALEEIHLHVITDKVGRKADREALTPAERVTGEVMRKFKSELVKNAGKPITGNRIRDLFHKSAKGADGLPRIHPNKIAEGLKFAKILCEIESEQRGFGDWIHTVHSAKNCRNELAKWGIDYTRKKGKKPTLEPIKADFESTEIRKESAPIPTYKSIIYKQPTGDKQTGSLDILPPAPFDPAAVAPF